MLYSLKSLNEQAQELRGQGKTIREIAHLLGVSKSSVDRMLKSVPVVPANGDGTKGTSGTKGNNPIKPVEDETLF